MSIVKRTAVGAGLLPIIPAAVWVSGWSWQPGYNVWRLRSLYWIAGAVAQPWGIITHVVLCAWFLWCLRFRLKTVVMLFMILAMAILVGQGVKSWVKDRVQEPWPFVVWLEKTHHIPVNEFYTLKRKDHGHLAKEQLVEQQDILMLPRKHWQKEIGFTSPPGHTTSTASWTLLVVGLLQPRQRTLAIVLLLIWATGIMGGRLLLGMHRPRDLVVATLISWLLVTLVTWLTQRACGPLTLSVQGEKEIAQREQESQP